MPDAGNSPLSIESARASDGCRNSNPGSAVQPPHVDIAKGERVDVTTDGQVSLCAAPASSSR
jgi:hypothetical protein